MVQTGKVFGVCLVTQSKHSVRSCGRYQQPSRGKVRRANLENRLDLAQVTRSTRFDQWDVGSHAHLVHVSPCIYTQGHQNAGRDPVAVLRTEVVQSVQNNVKCPEPRNVELRVFDVGVDGVYSDVGVECGRSLRRNLSTPFL